MAAVAALVIAVALFASKAIAAEEFFPTNATARARSSGVEVAQSGATSGEQSGARPTAAPDVKGYTLSKERYEQAVAYSRDEHVVYFVSVAYGALILIVILAGRWGPRFRDVAERVSRFRFVQAVVFTSILLITMDVARLPLSAYSHRLSLKYDQSVQGWPSWLWDQAKGELIAIVVGSLIVWVMYGIIRRSPRRWWFYFWLTTIPFTVFTAIVEPVFIAPLFFTFEPLQTRQPALAAQIEKVAERGGLKIAQSRMFEMNASDKMKSLNAYVSGFGPSKRVVVYDTTIAKMTTPEILFVFGHEMGHYVLGHIVKGMVVGEAILLVGLYLAFLWINREVSRRGPRWGIRGVDDWASLPALMLFAAVLSFLMTPVLNAYSRHDEHQADVYGLEVTHSIVPNSSEVAAQAFQILGEADLGDPNPSPFVKFWFLDHPSINDRILFARSYDPWSKGQPPAFVR